MLPFLEAALLGPLNSSCKLDGCVAILFCLLEGQQVSLPGFRVDLPATGRMADVLPFYQKLKYGTLIFLL